jgi:hypothetical protein
VLSSFVHPPGPGLAKETMVGPGSDAAVVRVKGTTKALAMKADGNGRYGWLDPFEGARLAVAEACRNVVAMGATPIGATNCLNFGNPEKPEVMGQLVRAIAGIGEATAKWPAARRAWILTPRSGSTPSCSRPRVLAGCARPTTAPTAASR